MKSKCWRNGRNSTLRTQQSEQCRDSDSVALFLAMKTDDCELITEHYLAMRPQRLIRANPNAVRDFRCYTALWSGRSLTGLLGGKPNRNAHGEEVAGRSEGTGCRRSVIPTGQTWTHVLESGI